MWYFFVNQYRLVLAQEEKSCKQRSVMPLVSHW